MGNGCESTKAELSDICARGRAGRQGMRVYLCQLNDPYIVVVVIRPVQGIT